MIILLALVTRACTEKLMANAQPSVDKVVDSTVHEVVDPLFNRQLQSSPFHRTDAMDIATLGKAGHLRAPVPATRAMSASRIPTHAMSASRISAYVPHRVGSPFIQDISAQRRSSSRFTSRRFAAGARGRAAVPAVRVAAATSDFETATLGIPTQKIDVGPFSNIPDEITEENPLRVIIAGAGIGGLALASTLAHDPKIHVEVLEQTDKFKRFGGPIQLASNALQVLKEMDANIYDQIMEKFTLTGDKQNGIKDGIRNEWYARFDLKTPADDRNLPYTGVIERPDLQEIYLKTLGGIVKNGDGVARYETNPEGHGVKAVMQSGAVHEGDVIIGADGIWSQVRATMRNTPPRGSESGVTYSGYTVFAGELNYDSFDNGEVGYKVYIGPEQYFVITDIGNGRYQWYAFLVREPGSTETEPKPDGSVAFLADIFKGWSPEIHHILNATKENEIGQRDLYDLPPSVRKPWSAGPVALLGDSVHAMMPNLGQGGGQAIEDAFVVAQELKAAKSRGEIEGKFRNYRSRRLVRSAAVQGLSRIASDLVINTFNTPAKIVFEGGGLPKFENFNYLGIFTRLWQPILPIFFKIQFAFLYDGWRNEAALDLKAALGFLFIGGAILLAGGGFGVEAGLGLELGLESVFGTEGAETLLANIKDFFPDR
eukprot:gnl/MRDRNA2_/MRDRNA2_56719_c0_seq1.p1 gnl/MRDRNA2_/MRDRNA2_56719_c0~~gnl/MRDRNA2_/MRDRNA2_56719_c0_seq1.p1  ORF type:complete len:656 (+),score=137.10 gnl/MRDRNA2_/MRDRNA2_56719_c0_seq1:98-2065(+)